MHCRISHSLSGISNYTAMVYKLLLNVINWKGDVSLESVKSFHSAFGLHLLFSTDGYCWGRFIMAISGVFWATSLVLLTAFLGFLGGQVVHCLGLHPSNSSLALLWFMPLCGANDFFKHRQPLSCVSPWMLHTRLTGWSLASCNSSAWSDSLMWLNFGIWKVVENT